MLRWLAVASFTALVSSCYIRHSISEKELTAILVDMYLADEIMMETRSSMQFRDSAMYYKSTLDKHGRTYDEFRDALNFYMQNKPLEMDKIYEQVVVRLTALQAKYAIPLEEVLPYNTEEETEEDRFPVPRWLRWNNYDPRSELIAW